MALKADYTPSVSDASVKAKKGMDWAAWFPAGTFKVTSTQTNTSVRGVWEGGSRVDLNLYEKPGGRAQITIEQSKLGDADAVEPTRAEWKEALGKLAGLLKA